MHEITLPSGTVVSVSAANKTQIANAEILFGKNAKLIVKKIDELVKIKELDTAKLSAVLDLLNDAAATTALAKKAAGKNLVTAMKNLYKAKTLVATINGLRAIKIKATDPNKVVAKPRAGKPQAPVTTVGTFSPAYSSLIRSDARDYAPDFIRAVEPVAGAGKFLYASGKQFSFQYKKLEVAVVMQQKGWLMTFVGDHLKKVKKVQIHLGELRSIKNVIKLLATKDATDAEIATAAKKGERTAAELRMPSTSNASSANGYDFLYDALMKGGEGENVRAMFKAMQLPAPKRSVTATVANMGGDEDCILVMGTGSKTGVVFGPTASMTGSIKQARGRGKFTVAKYDSSAGAPSDLPKSAFEQLGTFSDYQSAYQVFRATVSTL